MSPVTEETEAQKDKGKEKCNPVDPGAGTSKQENPPKVESPRENASTKNYKTQLSDENICRFYNRGVCKHMKDCKF